MTEHDTTDPRPQPDASEESSLAGPSNTAATPVGGECDYAPRVSAYHDGEVSQDEARELTAHIAGCQACAAQLAFFGRVSRTFDSAALPHLAPEARNRLEALTGEALAGEAPQSNRLRIKPSADVRWVRRLTAAAAVLFIIAVGKVIYDQQFPGPKAGTVIPTSNPQDPVVPTPQPVSQDGHGASQAPGDSKTPAVSDADFVVGQPAPKPPASGPAQKP